MDCDYCFLDLNGGRATVLDEAAAYKACADHLARASKSAPRFTILGGEPFLHYPLLKGIVDYLVANAPCGTPINVVTNGALVCPEKLDYLLSRKVSVTVSLDGLAESNDRHRVLVGRRTKSALGAALKSLESFDKSRLKANMVVCPDTVGKVLSNIESIRALGFRQTTFNLNIVGEWPPESLRALEKAAAGLARYYKALAKASPKTLELGHLSVYAADTAHAAGAEHGYDDLILGADGKYYACDGVFTLPYAKLGRWVVGSASKGVDWARREAVHREAQAFIHGALGGEAHCTCPREAYFHAICTGREPGAAIRAFHRAEGVLAAALAPLAAERRLGAYDRLL